MEFVIERMGSGYDRRMRPRARIVTTAVLAGVVLGTTGCQPPLGDELYVQTFTDSHGRACTVVYTVQARNESAIDGEGRDIDVTKVDCEYPPAGRQPQPGKISKL